MSGLYDRTPFDTPSIPTLPPAHHFAIDSDVAATVLDMLAAHDALDVAAMLGLTEPEDE